MLYTIEPEGMRREERAMMAATGCASLTLMERAAEQVAAVVAPYLREGGKLLVLCGTGNNGGDGLAAARILMGRMPQLKTVLWRLAGNASPETAEQWTRLTHFASRMTIVTLDDAAPSLPPGVMCAVDAMYGTGLNRPLSGAALNVARLLNGSACPVVAVDIPSGLCGVTGCVLGGDAGAAVHADVTVTFHRPKTGLFLADGLDACGRVVVADIGIPTTDALHNGLMVLTRGDRLLPHRKRNTHKGDYGRLVMVTGSFGMAGAAALSALAALRAGAGLVTVACPASIVPTVQTLCPCATCLPVPEEDAEAAWQRLLPALANADALVAGCGMGQTPYAAALLQRLTVWLCDHALPAVLDADALNWLARYGVGSVAGTLQAGDAPILETPVPDAAFAYAPITDALTSDTPKTDAPNQDAPASDTPNTDAPLTAAPVGRLPDHIVLTPHIGEAARLLRLPAERIARDQVGAARAIRAAYGGMVVLKSASSVLIAQDGEAINLFGTAGMAKGGSGDALAGVLGAMLAGQAMYGLTGARLLQTACALHGLAGMLAEEARGERGMLATDLCEALGRVPDVAERGTVATVPLSGRVDTVFDHNTVSLYTASEEALNLSQLDVAPPTNPPAPLAAPPFSTVLGRSVRVTVDRPLGTRHPEHKDTTYLLNYGYVADVLAADNEWQDAYVWGVREPLEVFEGEVVAVIHRLDDVEDKWIVAAPGTRVTVEEVRAATNFAEKYFRSEVLLPPPR